MSKQIVDGIDEAIDRLQRLRSDALYDSNPAPFFGGLCQWCGVNAKVRVHLSSCEWAAEQEQRKANSL